MHLNARSRLRGTAWGGLGGVAFLEEMRWGGRFEELKTSATSSELSAAASPAAAHPLLPSVPFISDSLQP